MQVLETTVTLPKTRLPVPSSSSVASQVQKMIDLGVDSLGPGVVHQRPAIAEISTPITPGTLVEKMLRYLSRIVLMFLFFPSVAESVKEPSPMPVVEDVRPREPSPPASQAALKTPAKKASPAAMKTPAKKASPAAAVSAAKRPKTPAPAQTPLTAQPEKENVSDFDAMLMSNPFAPVRTASRTSFPLAPPKKKNMF